MLDSELLYKSTSDVGVGKFIVWKLLLSFLLYYLFQRFEENRIVIGILICFVSLFFLLHSFETIKLYEDRIEVRRTSIVPIFTRTELFNFYQLKEIHAYYGLKTNYAIEVLPIGGSTYVQHRNEITFFYKDGEEKKLYTMTTSKRQFVEVFKKFPKNCDIKITSQDRKLF